MKTKPRVFLLLGFLLPGTGLAQAGQPVEQAPALEAQESAPAAPVAEEDPCHQRRDQEMLGLDWSRRELFRLICGTARWFDGFFGEDRYDESAAKLRGRLSYTVERRERVGMNEDLRFSVRVPLPNLNRRFDVFVEREDENRSIAGRSDAEPGAVAAPAPQESTQAGVGLKFGEVIDQLLDFRAGARVRDGKLDPFIRAKYRKEFAETPTTQWRFSQSIFHTRFDGFGETSTLDYEIKVTRDNLLRWSNNATWSQTTLGLDWRTGLALYRSLGDRRAAFVEVAASGASDAAVDVGNYGVRAAYRRTLGRNWLLGELFVGQDYPQSAPEIARQRQFFAGATIEVLFGNGH